MKNLFIPYELAVLAKENEFNEPCLGTFNKEKEGQFDMCNPILIEGIKNSECSPIHIAAPLYQQIVDWFREKHQVFITILPDKHEEKVCYHTTIDTNTDYSYSLIRRLARDKSDQLEMKFDYYEALNKAIEQAFKLI